MARLLVVVPSPTDPPERLGEWLRAAGLELDVRSVGEGDELPDDLAGVDGLVVLGGPQSSLDDAATSPELTGVRALLAQAVAGDVPTLAVCLGAQLLAQVAGGRIRVGTEGPEVGAALVAKRDAAERDPLFGPLPMTPDVVQWHHDEVSELPPGALLLAAGPVYPHQAFRVGQRVYGLQFHVEPTAARVAQWAHGDPAGVAASPFDADTHAERVAAVADDLAAVWAPFAGRFADLVRARAGAAARP
ncbi:type 1 glutamine amidotransferase [Geodermatophilus marinus]|uniref:type 1 glutamine amidotransferase n=1 Tax=Geodermatophilus sp. LHW52908 TaxID=2303986 RepID=UPI0018F408B9|nr:type 1 glutamine amidotransferase [Geodermatophilus sp. LHW52908]